MSQGSTDTVTVTITETVTHTFGLLSKTFEIFPRIPAQPYKKERKGVLLQLRLMLVMLLFWPPTSEDMFVLVKHFVLFPNV